MGRAPCCDKTNVKRGPWAPEEDAKLKDYIGKYGTGGNWISLPKKAGLRRCGKSCRLRWLNYLRPNIKHGEFSEEEDRIICTLYASIGSRWSIIASQLQGRTDNDIKNYWNTKLKKKLMGINYYPSNQRRLSIPFQSSLPPASHIQAAHQSTMMPTTGTDFGLPPNYLYNNTNDDSSTPFINQYYCNFGMKDGLMNPGRYNNMVMFGGNNNASCSSSDGSCSYMSSGNIEVKQESMSYLSPECNLIPRSRAISAIRSPSNFYEDEQKFILGYGGISCGDILSATGNFGNPSHDFLQVYDNLEEVKQLHEMSSSSNNHNNNNSGSFYFNKDENKTNQKTMYFD